MKKILNKCPLCGGKLKYSALMQYSCVHTIKSNGELSKKVKKEDIGPMECGFISCSNSECNFTTNCDLECEEHKNIEIWLDGDKYFYNDNDFD